MEWTIILTAVGIVVGYQVGALVTEVRSWRIIRDHQQAANEMLDRMAGVWAGKEDP